MTIHHFAVGKIKAMVLNDGFEPINEEEIVQLIKPLPDAFLQAYRQGPPVINSYNVLYFESGGECILIDTGLGGQVQPEFGHLLELLQKEGISPDQIDKIIL